MGIFKAFAGAISGTFADQWKDIITAGPFNEHVAVSPGILKSFNNGRGTNYKGSDGVISNGSKIYVPENTAAFIFSQNGIEEIITEPGGYEYKNGQNSFFNGDGFINSIFGQIKDRIEYGGISSDYKKIAFVNLREIRDIKFGTRGPQMYHDIFYDADLEIQAYGAFSIKITDPITFIRSYVPANIDYYSFDEQAAHSQILSEFLQSFTTILNSLSDTYRISQLPSQKISIANIIANDQNNIGTWENRFGFRLIKVAIENIEYTDDSRALVQQYSSNKMNMKAYDDVSARTSNIVAQQKIAEGIKENGLGSAAGMVFGMNMAQNLGPNAQSVTEKNNLDEQISTLKKFKELLDSGILTQEEFDAKKKEILGL
jgi:membrane protease subunit (stomatin/prohibitin family)